MNSESLKIEQNEHLPVALENQEVVVPTIDPSVKAAALNEAINIQIDSANETEDKIAALRADLGITGETVAPSVDIARKNAEKLTAEKDALEGVTSQEGFAENNIMSEGILDKVAQLEAIDPYTGEFDQKRYDRYMGDQAKLGTYSVESIQAKIKAKLDAGKQMSDATRRVDQIYGVGGTNRYAINPDGSMRLSRGSGVTSGLDSYKTALEEKALQFGFQVG